VLILLIYGVSLSIEDDIHAHSKEISRLHPNSLVVDGFVAIPRRTAAEERWPTPVMGGALLTVYAHADFKVNPAVLMTFLTLFSDDVSCFASVPCSTLVALGIELFGTFLPIFDAQSLHHRAYMEYAHDIS
jgi:hypothetical protein